MAFAIFVSLLVSPDFVSGLKKGLLFAGVCMLAGLATVILPGIPLRLTLFLPVPDWIPYHIGSGLIYLGTTAIGYAIVANGAQRIFDLPFNRMGILRIAAFSLIYVGLFSSANSVGLEGVTALASNNSFWLILGLGLAAESNAADLTQSRIRVLNASSKNIRILVIVLLALVPVVLLHIAILWELYISNEGTCYGWLDSTIPGNFLTCYFYSLLGISGLLLHSLCIAWVGMVTILGWPRDTVIEKEAGPSWTILSHGIFAALAFALALLLHTAVRHYEIKENRIFVRKVEVTYDLPAELNKKTMAEMQTLLQHVESKPGWIPREASGYVLKALTLTPKINTEDRDFDRGEVLVLFQNKGNRAISYPKELSNNSFGKGVKRLSFERLSYENKFDTRSRASIHFNGPDYILEITERALKGEEGILLQKFLQDMQDFQG